MERMALMEPQAARVLRVQWAQRALLVWTALQVSRVHKVLMEQPDR
jgi:hypothetical protein